jgi:ribosomal protein L11 methyltransferase
VDRSGDGTPPIAAYDAAGTTLARLTCDRSIAERLFLVLGESFDPDRTVCALSEAESGNWTVAVYFRDPPDRAAVRELIAANAGAGAGAALAFTTVAAADWVRLSQEGLPPVMVGRFVIHGAHDRARVRPNGIGIEIAAALAFGTGHHGTTQGCLTALEGWLKAHASRPWRIVDIGTGTGVLAIAAALATRRLVLASDVDAQAVAVAAANARLNRAGSLVRLVHSPGVTHRRLRGRAPYDLVLANILLGPLQRLARPLAGLLAPRARVILSGLMPEHANAALAAYRLQGLRLERRILRGGWTTLVLRRGRHPHQKRKRPGGGAVRTPGR